MKYLNLANNLISKFTGLSTLVELTELNLRNNMIEEIHGMRHLTKLKKLDLSNNFIQRIRGLEDLKHALKLTELNFVGNPIFTKQEYDLFCIQSCPNLLKLDMMRITAKMRSTGGGPSDEDKKL